jgi:hypothetical protein
VRQGNEISSSARIRDNQRRSRNRRKELIEDLQKRVQTYEQNGVTATQDMQRAARKVAQENLRLRSLLAHHGISQETVDIYLRSFDTFQVSSDISAIPAKTISSYQSVVPEKVPVHGLGAMGWSSSKQPAERYHITSHNFAPEYLEEDRTQEVIETVLHSTSVEHVDKPYVHEKPSPARGMNAQLDFHNNPRSDDSGCLNTTDCFCPPPINSPVRPLTSGMEISCETAANIIIEMRGNGDLESVRKSLGCAGREECSVRSSTVMQVMDEG